MFVRPQQLYFEAITPMKKIEELRDSPTSRQENPTPPPLCPLVKVAVFRVIFVSKFRY
jgi:hypothetical protein